jgi:hypothetical protein
MFRRASTLLSNMMLRVFAAIGHLEAGGIRERVLTFDTFEK